MKSISPVTFIDKLVKKNELGQPFRLIDHQREVLRLAFPFDSDGRLPYDPILYSCIKKSGKTTLNGALTLARGFTQEAPNEILILANDLEQTAAPEQAAYTLLSMSDRSDCEPTKSNGNQPNER